MKTFTYNKIAAAVAVALTSAPMLASATTGPSTSTAPYLLPSASGSGYSVTSILTAGDNVQKTGAASGVNYTMGGIPDGLGAYDNGDGTMTVLMNHEWGATVGANHTHNTGATTGGGAYVSKWVIDKATLTVKSGSDLIQTVNGWNTSMGAYSSAANVSFNRFCSADLAKVSAYFDSSTGKGYNGMIFMNGEESGAEGKAYGTVVANGAAYELASLGKFSWENSIASPYAQTKTIVMGTDDTSPQGQVYMYVGNKQTFTGTNYVEAAGLVGGNLYGVKVAGLGSVESRTTTFTSGAFTLHNFGDVSSTSGATLQTSSQANGLTEFLRPEDGAWDTLTNNKFYFVTTDRVNSGAQVGTSRLWAMTFNDIANPENGGNIEMLLNGTEGGQMFDNMTVDKDGNLILQEDVGNNALIGKVWKYNPTTDALTEILRHDASLFTTSGLTQDEESSGVIDVTDMFNGVAGYDTSAYRYYLLDTQNHATTGNPVTVEGGQLQLVAAPVPVPGAVWLFGSALAGLVGLRRRKA
jgi:hypothetical protein